MQALTSSVSMRIVRSLIRQGLAAHITYVQRFSTASGLGFKRRQQSNASPFQLLLLTFAPLCLAQGRPLAPKRESPSNGPDKLTGIWIRDDAASDLAAYGRMLEALQLNALQRKTAMSFIEGLELTDSEDALCVKFLTVVPFFKVTEQVAFETETQQSRRDLRPGSQVAKASRTPTGVSVETSWPEPLAGHLIEVYFVQGDDLIVKSHLVVGGRTEGTTVVYRRRGKWQPQASTSGIYS